MLIRRWQVIYLLGNVILYRLTYASVSHSHDVTFGGSEREVRNLEIISTITDSIIQVMIIFIDAIPVSISLISWPSNTHQSQN